MGCLESLAREPNLPRRLAYRQPRHARCPAARRRCDRRRDGLAHGDRLCLQWRNARATASPSQGSQRTGHLPEEQHEQAKTTLKAAFKLDARGGAAKIEKYATWLKRDHPSAAASVRARPQEMYTINRLGLPSQSRRCLGTTNPIDNGHPAAGDRMRQMKHWQSGAMALRWTAAASKGFRRIMDHVHIWMRKPALDGPVRDQSVVQQAAAGERRTPAGSPALPTTGGTSSTIQGRAGRGPRSGPRRVGGRIRRRSVAGRPSRVSRRVRGPGGPG